MFDPVLGGAVWMIGIVVVLGNYLLFSNLQQIIDAIRRF